MKIIKMRHAPSQYSHNFYHAEEEIVCANIVIFKKQKK